jgi:uncharacterized protein YodC (DUF2158 family)
MAAPKKDAPFKVGDIVCLKSGGPNMTVRNVRDVMKIDEPYVDCSWFAGKKHEEGVFPAAALNLVPPDDV